MPELNLTAEETKLLLCRALASHNAASLCPEWSKEYQAALEKALDRLRLYLFELIDEF
jgi:hypothetical protein